MAHQQRLCRILGTANWAWQRWVFVRSGNGSGVRLCCSYPCRFRSHLAKNDPFCALFRRVYTVFGRPVRTIHKATSSCIGLQRAVGTLSTSRENSGASSYTLRPRRRRAKCMLVLNHVEQNYRMACSLLPRPPLRRLRQGPPPAPCSTLNELLHRPHPSRVMRSAFTRDKMSFP